MNQIVTRFAPSPSGYLHVGGARTALFNWLYARHMKGRFLLRIEDTDAARSTQASVEAIFEALKWLGIDWDEGPYFQSERSAVYAQHIQQLLDTGHAYWCTCSVQRLDEVRKKAMQSGRKPKYDGVCRHKGNPQTADAVIRFKAPLTGTTTIEDVIKGHIKFQNEELDDFIIARADGSPTYNFVVVVDDMTMGINTVIRGDDHVMNTPKQIQLYHALGASPPTFGHVPMVLGADKSRLSKRHGAMSVTAYRDMGYLPDAFINYMVRLGWSYGDQEFFGRDELIEKFTLKNVGRSASVFDIEKLSALNADHIKTASHQTLETHLVPLLEQRGIAVHPGAFLHKVIDTLILRSKTLAEMADGASFYFEKDITYEPKGAKKFLKQAALPPLQALYEKLSGLADFDQKTLEAVFSEVMETSGLKLGKIAQPVRVALTGKTVSPGIFEIIDALGKSEVLKRLEGAIQYIKDQPE